MIKNTEQEDNHYVIKPYSLKELAGMYGVAKNTYKKWLAEFSKELGVRKGYYYSIEQVRLIFEKLGTPQTTPKRPKGNSSGK